MSDFTIREQAEEARLSAMEFQGQTDAMRAKKQPPPDEVLRMRAYRQQRKEALAHSMARWADKVESREAAE